ncbi:hypothetical protein IJI31_00285 [bacterium]|nr:hypothetical protein [bacterium]
MSTIASQITALENESAYNKQVTRGAVNNENDKDMFLSLMLTQLKHQDPSEPMENTEWLSQLANYSSLEQMTQVNSNLEDMSKYLSTLTNDLSTNFSITQTLSLIGKEVDISYENEYNETIRTTGKVTEASVYDGTGVVKVNGEYYSIANIQSIRESAEE